MSRSGYSDDHENQWAFIRWRGAVRSALRGTRGQAFLRELVSALDALPEPELTADVLEADGAYCALGAVGRLRGIDMRDLDPHNHDALAETFGIAQALTREIEFVNDEWVYFDDARQRWTIVREWALENLISKSQPEQEDAS